MFILESIPFSDKTGWTTESMPLYKKQAEALLRARQARNTGSKRRRYRLTKVK